MTDYFHFEIQDEPGEGARLLGAARDTFKRLADANVNRVASSGVSGPGHFSRSEPLGSRWRA